MCYFLALSPKIVDMYVMLFRWCYFSQKDDDEQVEIKVGSVHTLVIYIFLLLSMKEWHNNVSSNIIMCVCLCVWLYGIWVAKETNWIVVGALQNIVKLV